MADLDFNSTIVLENDRVLLRPLQKEDAAHLLDFALHEPGIWQYSLVRVAGEDYLNSYIAAAITAREAKTDYPFIVFDKQQSRYAGSTRFYDIQLRNSSLQLGYTWYGKDFQGTGLNAHCKFLLLQLAFETLGMQRVEFRADNDNKRSIAAMKSIGCTAEGVLRSHLPKPEGGRRDSIVLSILKHEWDGRVKDLLKKKMSAGV